jgi:regulation of enolase protein 1 (concanavalin A-like superfamily)
VSLQFSPVTYGNLKGYNVYRSLSPSSGYSLIGSIPASQISYLDSGAQNGVISYYRVTAVDATSAAESLAPTASAMPVSTVVADKLTSVDIAATPAGSTSIVTPGTDYNVTAGGPGISGTSDGFRFLFQQQTGDFDVMVQVQSLTAAGNYSTAGIMARSTLDANSADVYMSASPLNFRFKYRPSAGALTTVTASNSAPAFPNAWVRLSRVGNLFTAYTSTDGVHWTQMSSVTLSLPSTLDLGLAVASNVNTTTTTAQLRGYATTVINNVPPAPTGLTATAGQSGVSLGWTAVQYANLKGYNVYRSTTAAGPFTLLAATPVTMASYLDTTAPSGTYVYYQVTAVDATSSAESPAAAVKVAVTSTVPPQSLGIGESPAGSTTVITPGTDYDVTAGGPGVTGTSDGFRFLYQQWTGDFDVKVQVQSLTVAGNFSTAGIMARATLDANSADVYMSASPVNYRFKSRATTGGTTTVTASGSTSYPNVWVRLTRVGNLFSGYSSTDGVNWTLMSSATLSLPNTVYLGLAVASNVSTTTTTAQLRGYANT